MKIIMLMARKMRIYSAQEIELSFSEAYTRICHALSYLSETYGVHTEDGIRINVKFTHQELADMVNASRVSVANVFSDLTRSGIIRKDGGHYIIERPELL